MLYTKKGDNGTTKLFNTEQGKRLSKSAPVFEVLGSLDELNCFLGYVKVLSRKQNLHLLMDSKISFWEILERFQESLFCLQAEVGGSDVSVKQKDLDFLEQVVSDIEKTLPPINNFVIPGGSEVSAFLDIARTITRRTERCFVVFKESPEAKTSELAMKYLNRLSSALYAMARFTNHEEGRTENSPNYG